MTEQKQPELTPEPDPNAISAPQTPEPNVQPLAAAEPQQASTATASPKGLSSTRVLLMLVGILAIVGLSIGGTVLVQNWLNPDQHTSQPPSGDEELTEEEQLEEVRRLLLELPRRDAGDPLALGPVDAPLVLIGYADYQCRYCVQFARETMPALISEYVEAGTLRIEWRDVPIFGEESIATALAAHAAANQGKYWEYHDALIAHSPHEPDADLSEEALVQLAREVGVADIERFQEDLADPATLAKVQADYVEGAQYLGIDSTPSFVLGGIYFAGAQPIEVFRELIAQELALIEP